MLKDAVHKLHRSCLLLSDVIEPAPMDLQFWPGTLSLPL
jgi:hypothetical protein